MFSVITCIRDNHDWRLVLAAAAVCLVGATAAMLLLGSGTMLLLRRQRQNTK